MNFLALVQKLRQRTGGASNPVTVIGQSGEALDYVDWINEAWTNIQTLEGDWKWMRRDVAFQTTAGKVAYLPSATVGETGIADLAKWNDSDSWRCYKTATGRTDESFLVPWDYQTWRDSYDFGLQTAIQSKPSVWAIRDSDFAILLGSTPDGIYTVTGQYQTVPTSLALDVDVPGMPARFHMLIVYKAMMLYGAYEAATEVYNEGKAEADKMLAALRNDQLDEVHLGDPLA